MCDNVWQCFRNLDYSITIYQISGLQYYCNSRLNIQVRDSNTVCQISGLYKYCSMLNIQDNSQVSEAFPILKKRYLGYSITVCQMLQYVRYLYYSITRCLISGLQCYRMLISRMTCSFVKDIILKKQISGLQYYCMLHVDIWIVVLQCA